MLALLVFSWEHLALLSFRVSFSKAYSPLIIILIGGLIYGLWNYAQLLFLTLATSYVASGPPGLAGSCAAVEIRAPGPEIKIA